MNSPDCIFTLKDLFKIFQGNLAVLRGLWLLRYPDSMDFGMWLLFFLAVLGAIFGSFVNMLAHRLPAEKEIVFKGSHCPHCEHALGLKDLVPIFSYVFLKGACGYCKHPIGRRYFWTECCSMLLFMLAMLGWPDPIWMTFWCVFSVLALAMAVIDFEHYMLPDTLNAVFAAVGLGFAFFQDRGLASLLSALICAVVFLLIRQIGTWIYKKEAMGLGDIKLALGMGAWVGLDVLIFVIYDSFIVALLIAGLLYVAGGFKKISILPFGPAMLVSIGVHLLFLDSLKQFYMYLGF